MQRGLRSELVNDFRQVKMRVKWCWVIPALVSPWKLRSNYGGEKNDECREETNKRQEEGFEKWTTISIDREQWRRIVL